MDEEVGTCSEAERRRFSVAIVGMGRAGEIHIGNCRNNMRINIKYIVDIDTSKAHTLKQRYMLDDTTVVHADDFDSVVLSDADVAGVIVATVTYAHEEYVKKCIRVKKAIFCEKPIAGNLCDTRACYESAEEAGVPIFCAFNRRFDATHAGVRSAAVNGEVGQLHMVKICSRDSPLPSEAYLKISGGIFHDCAVHDIDMAMWILRECPDTVFSHAHAWKKFIADMDDVDSVSISMKFPSGAIAQIDLSRLAVYGYDQRVEVFGDGGMLESENRNKTTLRKSTNESVSNQLIDYSFPTRYSAAYAAEIEHFADIMGGKTKPSITKNDVLLVSLVASACEESHRSGKPMKIDRESLTYSPTV